MFLSIRSKLDVVFCRILWLIFLSAQWPSNNWPLRIDMTPIKTPGQLQYPILFPSIFFARLLFFHATWGIFVSQNGLLLRLLAGIFGVFPAAIDPHPLGRKMNLSGPKHSEHVKNILCFLNHSRHWLVSHLLNILTRPNKVIWDVDIVGQTKGPSPWLRHRLSLIYLRPAQENVGMCQTIGIKRKEARPFHGQPRKESQPSNLISNSITARRTKTTVLASLCMHLPKKMS